MVSLCKGAKLALPSFLNKIWGVAKKTLPVLEFGLQTLHFPSRWSAKCSQWDLRDGTQCAGTEFGLEFPEWQCGHADIELPAAWDTGYRNEWWLETVDWKQLDTCCKLQEKGYSLLTIAKLWFLLGSTNSEGHSETSQFWTVDKTLSCLQTLALRSSICTPLFSPWLLGGRPCKVSWRNLGEIHSKLASF